MNTERRKKIDEAFSLLERAKGLIEECANDEREYFDNMPEAFQSGDKGQAAEQAADTLDEAASDIDDITSKLDDAKA